MSTELVAADCSRAWSPGAPSPLRLVGLSRAVLVAALVAVACGSADDEPTVPPGPGFHRVVLTRDVGEPMSLALLPDGRVLHSERQGNLWLFDPATGEQSLAARLPVYAPPARDEDGLQGIALDPEFEQNGWVYLYYSPPLDTPLDDPSSEDVDESLALETGSPADWEPFRGFNRLSRFRFDTSELLLDSEQPILEVGTDRGICCHVGGQIDFDGDGNLYLSTGDDSNPFRSDGFTPIDARPERNPAFDARRSASNTNDLRGKLLRIKVAEDGSYTIPEGNLFAPGSEGTRPEIYVMGLRNPFRFALNRLTNEIYLADYSPDAQLADPLRGPPGQGKWTVIRQPGNYGWPLCATAELPYVAYDFATETSAEPFDCAAPVNDSPLNTGLRELPAVEQPSLWYSYRTNAFAGLGRGGIAPMAGPAYVYDPDSLSPIKWPAELDGLPLLYEWTRDYVRDVQLDDAGAPSVIGALLSVAAVHPIDVEFGPDGALYVLEYGVGYYRANPDASLSRIEFGVPE
jgi:cytochrome c